MCIIVSATSPQGCCRKEIAIQCHVDQFGRFLYAKAGRVVSDKCPKLHFQTTPWKCRDKCEYIFHHEDRSHGEYWPAEFNEWDDRIFLEKVRNQKWHFNYLAKMMKKEFNEKGAGDAAVTKAIENLNKLPEDATLEDKAKEFAAMGFVIKR